MSKTYSKTRILVECALMIALATVLHGLKLFTMPNGGSITVLSMLPIILVSFRHGVKWGLFTGFADGCLQILLNFWAPPWALPSSLPARSKTAPSAWPWAPLWPALASSSAAFCAAC